MRFSRWLSSVCLLLGTAAVAQPQLDAARIRAHALEFFSPLPERAEAPGVVLTPERIELGKKLYFDPRLSRSGRISCSSCHGMASAGTDNLSTAIGDRWAVGPRNTLTTWNAALHVRQFWDARAATVEDQALHPIINPIEMALPAQEAVERLASIPEYRALFAAAFPDEDQPLTFRNIGIALGAFERTLITPSRFDDFLRGDLTALDEKELMGVRTFIGMGCVLCHNGVGIGGGAMQKFGVFRPYWEVTKSERIDEGRSTITDKELDRYFFRIPSLRNVAKTYPYFHDGSVWRLQDAVRTMAAVQLGKTIEDDEIEHIVTFLKTLSGTPPEAALIPPVLPASTPETPRPTP